MRSAPDKHRMDKRIIKTLRKPEQDAVRLRSMSVADVSAVLQLERQSYPTPWPACFFRRMLRRRASCWVYERNGMILGYGVMRCSREWAHILNLCIARRYRRGGLGRRMLIHMMRAAQRCGAKLVWLEVHPDNRGAINLYKSLGFSIRYRRKDYYRYSPQRQRDALIMVSKLGH